jgi:hypothetical protein
MQCKDIPDLPVLVFLTQLPFLAVAIGDKPVQRWGTWVWGDDFKPDNSVIHAMPAGTPPKLALAKMKSLIKRGLVDGCGCGCRGDFEITGRGRQAVQDAQHQAAGAAVTGSPHASAI